MRKLTKKYTTEEFITRYREVHGNKYDYSKAVYINSWTLVRIICRIHGEFLQIPNSHLQGHGCPSCVGLKKPNTEEFIVRARKVHGNYYNYSKVVYVNSKTKIIIICPIHGEFWQRPKDHLHGHGCQSCVRVKKPTTEEFIKKAKKVHGNKYDYSGVVYVNSRTKIIIICPIHGKFLQKPSSHLNGNGCQKCAVKLAIIRMTSTRDKFITKAIKIHGNYYDYSKVIYVNTMTEVIIICPIHGKFTQMPCSHLNGHGCMKCSGKEKLTTEEFIKRAINVHGNYYNYSRAIYVNNFTLLIIICPIHGEFMQTPICHIDRKCGCRMCRSSRGELLIAKILDKNKINFVRQKKFPDCKNIRKLPFDFYLPENNMLIEFNGKQHYKYNPHWNKIREEFTRQQHRDRIKKKYALSHGYKFLVIKYNENIEEKLKETLSIL